METHGKHVNAFVLIECKSKNAEIEERVLNLDRVSELSFVTGKTPYIARLSAVENSDIAEAIGIIGSIEGVSSAEALVVLQSFRSDAPNADAVQNPVQPTSSSGMPYVRFLRGLVGIGVSRSPHLHSNMRVREKPFIRAKGSMLRGLYNYYYSGKTWGRVELYIDRGNFAENKAIFDRLHASKEAIEEEYGGPLNWARLDNKRACRISKVINGGYSMPASEWQEIQIEMVDAMIRLESALRPHLSDLKTQYR